MKTFSVEGTSTASMEAAMADAMAKVGTMSQGAGKVDVAVASVTKDGDIFHVSVSVIAHPPEDKETDDKQGEGGEGARNGKSEFDANNGNDAASRQLNDEMIYHAHTIPQGMSIEEAHNMGRQMIESSPDTSAYVDTLADGNSKKKNHATEAATFDVMQESASAEPSGAEGTRVTMLAREVDEVVGLLSLGLYEPPRPHDKPNQTVSIKGGEEDEEKAPDTAPLPTEPPVPAEVQPVPGR